MIASGPATESPGPLHPEDHADVSIRRYRSAADFRRWRDLRHDDRHSKTRADKGPAGCTHENGTISASRPIRRATEKGVEIISVRVVDMLGRRVADVEVKVYRGRCYTRGRWARIRASMAFPHWPRRAGRGRRRPALFSGWPWESRQNESETMGWASLVPGQLWPKATDEDPVTLMLLPRNRRAEGSIVDTRGKPIGGAHVREVSVPSRHERFRDGLPGLPITSQRLHRPSE